MQACFVCVGAFLINCLTGVTLKTAVLHTYIPKGMWNYKLSETATVEFHA